MLRGNRSIATYSVGNAAIWMLLAFQAGTINAGGLLSCHRFVSHVTGFATMFGLQAGQEQSIDALSVLIVPLFFLTGGILSGLLVDIRLHSGRAPLYYVCFGLIFLMLLVATLGGVSGYFGEFGTFEFHRRGYLLLILLCTACGMQNAAVTSVSRSTIRTTHLTGITTDLGIGIVRYFLDKRFDEGRANAMRIGLIFSFVAGSIAGARLFLRFHFEGFIVPAFTSGGLFVVMLANRLRKPYDPK